MTRSLVIAPQWIGDAVMTEPLLRHLQARGEASPSAPCPGWRRCIAPCPSGCTRCWNFPSRGGLRWSARRRWARQLRQQFDVAYVF